MTWIISNVAMDPTEYTSMYPWIPMKCFEFRILYSSCTAVSVVIPPRAKWLELSTNLSRRVDNLGRVILSLVPDRLGEGILNGRVVALDEATVDELDRKRRLACCAYTVSRRLD